jgi:hypothetical protein
MAVPRRNAGTMQRCARGLGPRPTTSLGCRPAMARSNQRIEHICRGRRSLESRIPRMGSAQTRNAAASVEDVDRGGAREARRVASNWLCERVSPRRRRRRRRRGAGGEAEGAAHEGTSHVLVVPAHLPTVAEIFRRPRSHRNAARGSGPRPPGAGPRAQERPRRSRLQGEASRAPERDLPRLPRNVTQAEDLPEHAPGDPVATPTGFEPVSPA